jgi:hypothetical protein
MERPNLYAQNGSQKRPRRRKSLAGRDMFFFAKPVLYFCMRTFCTQKVVTCRT